MNKIINTVISNDYCIGCGVCASLDETPFEIKLNENGIYQAYVNSDQYNRLADKICPFYNNENETELAKEVFVDSETKFNDYTGYYLENFVGYVKEKEFRIKGSSGGMGNWIAYKLLEENLVDGIIHVKESEDPNLIYEYQISNTTSELFKGAKSKYYPIELSKVLKIVKENKGKYALIGIPCFIKSVRLLAKHDKVINERIKFFIGLVCGHLKSTMFAKSIGWELGIHPDELTNIDFRKKLPDRGANDYGVEVVGKIDDKITTKSSPTKELSTTNWGQGYFKYNACELCDDVLAETADITVGDAWLPGYRDDYLGTNIITIRNRTILDIVRKNIQNNNLHLENVTADTIYESQAGGFRHRRDGLSYRLYMKDKQNVWRPKKRVVASNQLTKKRKGTYEWRGLLTTASFDAYKSAYSSNDFNVFIKEMAPTVKRYQNVIRTSFLRKVLSKIKRDVLKI